VTRQDRLPGNHLRTADSPDGPVCGSMWVAGPWATREAREAGRTGETPVSRSGCSFEGVITLEGPETRDA